MALSQDFRSAGRPERAAYLIDESLTGLPDGSIICFGDVVRNLLNQFGCFAVNCAERLRSERTQDVIGLGEMSIVFRMFVFRTTASGFLLQAV